MAIKPKHTNSGNCSKCNEIFNRYPDFHVGLKAWFLQLQEANPDAHISCAGRGKAEQELYFQRGSSKAHWGQSAHNFNCAIDIFQLHNMGARWDKQWFDKVVAPSVRGHNSLQMDFDITWYGSPGSKFFELPHCEVTGWKALGLKLVE